jgi:hypothetical protein
MGADETQIEASFCEACFGGNRCPVGPVEPIKNVHADVRQHDAPAKDSRPRYPESQPGASHRSGAEDAARELDEKYNVDVEVEIRTPNEKNDEDQSEATDWIISDFSEEEAMARRSA